MLEDDVAHLLLPNAAPPIETMAPERTYYILDTAKAVAAGLCIAHVVVPQPAFEGIARSICATAWMMPPLMAEIAGR